MGLLSNAEVLRSAGGAVSDSVFTVRLSSSRRGASVPSSLREALTQSAQSWASDSERTKASTIGPCFICKNMGHLKKQCALYRPVKDYTKYPLSVLQPSVVQPACVHGSTAADQLYGEVIDVDEVIDVGLTEEVLMASKFTFSDDDWIGASVHITSDESLFRTGFTRFDKPKLVCFFMRLGKVRFI